ncbi:hypothetical protein [Agromyces mariniharenae]|uniref:Uncharacterized protein n=1 Tax=Agromyces mariniharenae TaxID=2604423 RepID=A0A5S4UX65_9MICO|nr:hypothetical protein [Agromyces mariniharenae]TYL51162.1 hypothetical protein FYC51_18775 [Agromyces mariniharenae]
MSRIYMRVLVANDSDATLRLRHRSTSRSWTGGWEPVVQSETLPGGHHGWQAEGDLFIWELSGVEARVWYDVVAPSGEVLGELYIFANSPVRESQYGNTFHVHAPAGYYATYSDAKGQKNDNNRAVLEIRFRNTRKVAVRGFKPSKNGFQFSNGSWSDQLPVLTVGELWNRFRGVLTGGGLADALGITPSTDWLPLTHADTGLCGGMTYAVMDYFALNQIPPEAKKNRDGAYVPPDSADDPMFLFIRERLLDSFDFTGRGHRWLSYTSPIYPDDDEGVLQSFGVMKGKAWVTYREEWPRIRELLDNGKLATVGLVQSAQFDIGANHQVLAYAYEQSAQNVKLWIYDPNVPGQAPLPAIADDLYLEFDTSSTADGITVTRHNAPAEEPEKVKRIYALLLMDNYIPKAPPPGRSVPPPDAPKYFKLVRTDAESFTTGGTVKGTRKNYCQEVMETGMWTSRTDMTFVAQVVGYVDPVVSWTVAGVPVTDKTTAVPINVGGTPFSIGCRLLAGGRSLMLSSAPGDTYAAAVSVTMKDALGETKAATDIFDIEGTYEGPRIEHIRAETRCLERTIPVPVDIGDFVIPKEGPGPVEIEAWKAGVLARLNENAAINPAARAAIEAFVELQVDLPDIGGIGTAIAQRNRIGG